MSALEESQAGEYFSDTENAGEMARLIKQARISTRGRSGPFPKSLDLSFAHDVLDLACGPGEWVLHVAETHPEMQVTGVDISQTMLHFARSVSTHLSNVCFEQMDITQPLAFADASFDLIHSRFIFGFMKTTTWPTLLEECRRILRPGGMVILNEPEFGPSNSLAFEQMSGLFSLALHRAGQSFSPDGRHIGIIPMLGQLLTHAGFEQQQQEAMGSDLSAGTEMHKDLYEDYQVLFHLAQPFLIKMGVTTVEEFANIYHQMLQDMRSSTFRAIGFGLRAWAYKPS